MVLSWSGIHTVQAAVGAVAVTAEALHAKLTGSWSSGTQVVAVVATAVLLGLSYYSNAVFGPAAKEVSQLRAMAVKP